MKTGGYFMNNKNYQVEKLCGFYVSDWHLTTTILPYINSKIDEKTKVITILENNIEENIKVLMEKLNLKNKNEILSIRWTSVDSKKYTDISVFFIVNSYVHIVFYSIQYALSSHLIKFIAKNEVVNNVNKYSK